LRQFKRQLVLRSVQKSFVFIPIELRHLHNSNCMYKFVIFKFKIYGCSR
jgi:hypothetical protein